MTNYHARLREIQTSFVMGYNDRETCISQFEGLLHEFRLLPLSEVLDRKMTNENFMALLKMAREHKEPEHLQPQQGVDLTQLSHDINTFIDSVMPNKISSFMDNKSETPHYRIADSIKQRCPVCQKQVAGLYNRLQSPDNQQTPVDPPRCEECMGKWVEEHFGSPNTQSAEPAPSFSRDTTTAEPMSVAEFDFFKQYEQEMEGFKP